eukprot:CAMPEP_0197030194 /NCGR_PEP_ID=MMETSP1384-20130603/9476_1 /TAXON_ID=29189 /ORGANISM="Ammonia sp." /LENGTH=271 /DNA_ID=CAMNT_0042459489 /DNA_START=48 /DNA_END=860 /DNA_ORIENTATION=+
MTTATESEDYESTTELECFMHSPNESDVEIKVFDEDGMALSAKSDLDDHEALDHHHQSHGPLSTPSSDLYYILHNEAPQTSLHQTPWTTSTHSKRRKIKHLIKNLCEAPHLYIQQRHSNASQSSWSTLVNYHQFLDEYLSFKYFYELSLPLCLELLLSFGCMAFSPICIIILLTLDCLIWRHVQLAVFALLVSLSSFATLHILAYFRLLPCRALPNVIHNTDEYGFNVTRTLNLRYWYYRNKERNTCSFPDYNTCNAMIYALSYYLFSAHW